MSRLKIKDMPPVGVVDGTEIIPTGGKGDVSVTVERVKNYVLTAPILSSLQTDLNTVDLRSQTNEADISSHVGDLGNPHQVTKTQIGLGNVDNTSDLDKPISSSQQVALDLKEDKNKKGLANGYASLDSDGKVPQSQLPSYTDDVINSDSFALLPLTGEIGKIYITTDTNNIYRWNGIEYVDLNTLGIAKYADQLTVAKSITAVGDANWSVDFNGTSNVSSTITLANTGVTAGTYPKVTVDDKGRVILGNVLLPSDLPSATTTDKGAVQLVDNLTTGGTDKALTAEQGKLLLSVFATSMGGSGCLRIPNATDLSKPTLLQWATIEVSVVAGSNQFSGTWYTAFPTACHFYQGVRRNQISTDCTVELGTATGFSGWISSPISGSVIVTAFAVGN